MCLNRHKHRNCPSLSWGRQRDAWRLWVVPFSRHFSTRRQTLVWHSSRGLPQGLSFPIDVWEILRIFIVLCRPHCSVDNREAVERNACIIKGSVHTKLKENIFSYLSSKQLVASSHWDSLVDNSLRFRDILWWDHWRQTYRIELSGICGAQNKTNQNIPDNNCFLWIAPKLPGVVFGERDAGDFGASRMKSHGQYHRTWTWKTWLDTTRRKSKFWKMYYLIINRINEWMNGSLKMYGRDIHWS